MAIGQRETHWDGITEWQGWSQEGWKKLLHAHTVSGNAIPPACRDVWSYLSRDVRSPFYRVVPQDIRMHLEPHLEHLSERAPKTVKGFRPRIEGYHLEATGQEITYLYFTCPGAIIVTTDYTRGYFEPPYLGDVLTIKSSLLNNCAHITTLRNTQLAGLIDFALTNNSYIFEFSQHANCHIATANLILARKSLAFRVSIPRFAELCICNDEVGYIKNFATNELHEPRPLLRTVLLRNLTKEVSRRFFEFRFIHKIQHNYRADKIVGSSILAAQFLYEYYRSNSHLFTKYPCGNVNVPGALERVEFYFGLGDTEVNPVIDAITGKTKHAGVRKLLTFIERGCYEISNEDAIAIRDLLRESGYFDWKIKK